MLPFLRCVGEAVVARGMRGLMALVPFGEQIYEVSADAIERYRKQGKEREIAADIEATLRADIEDVRRQSAQIAAEVAAGRPAEEVERLTAYLTQVPSVAKQSLKRPADPTGTTVAASFDALDPVQLASLLPARSPRFKAGDLVPHASEWELVGLLGSGGFGDVWLARHTFLDEQRAFKFCLDPVARDRLLRHEGEVIKRVMQASRGVRTDEHGIVPLRGAYLAGEVPWLAYEYIDGGDLTALGRELQALPVAERGERALCFLRSLAGVVGALHRLSTPVVHRDLKPANVLVNKTPTGGYVLRVTDFGIGQVSADATVRSATVSTPRLSLGETYRGAHTPIYASPQQKRGAAADPRDDVHALGVIGYQLLLGDFGAERPAGKWRKRLAGYGIDDAVLEILESCWDDDQEERPRDAAVLAEMLTPTDGSGSARTPTQPPTVDSWADVDADVSLWRAHRLKHSDSMIWLAERGDNYPRWRAAARSGHAGAMVLCGLLCRDGLGGPQDPAEALRLFCLAANKGDAAAMCNVGILYYKGLGVLPNGTEAMRWFRLAASAGDASGMFMIAFIHYHGMGVPQNRAEAKVWFRRAADAGNTQTGDILIHNYSDA